MFTLCAMVLDCSFWERVFSFNANIAWAVISTSCIVQILCYIAALIRTDGSKTPPMFWLHRSPR